MSRTYACLHVLATYVWDATSAAQLNVQPQSLSVSMGKYLRILMFQIARYAWLQQNEPKIAAGWPHGVVCGIPRDAGTGSFEHEGSWMSWSTPSYGVFAAPRLKLSGEPVHKTNQLFEAKPGQISMGPQAAAEKWLRKMGLRATWGGCGPQLRNCYLFFFLLLLFFFFRLLRFKVIARSLQEPPAPPEQEEEVEDLEASHSLS